MIADHTNSLNGPIDHSEPESMGLVENNIGTFINNTDWGNGWQCWSSISCYVNDAGHTKANGNEWYKWQGYIPPEWVPRDYL